LFNHGTLRTRAFKPKQFFRNARASAMDLRHLYPGIPCIAFNCFEVLQI
jgi:hypothetical protein